MECYIHIPFCRQKCRYCDFASCPGQEALMPRYVDALLKEARQYAPAPLSTAFIGGGTPSTLPAPLLAKLLSGLKECFTYADGMEFTTEANPGTLTAPWLEAAMAGGVNRLSLGMQAYQPELLKTLGRIHDFAQVEASVRLAREMGLTNISLDLMFGLPGQTISMWRETLEAALSLQPQHLSCYGLIPEEGTPLTQDVHAGRLTLPDEDEERLMYDEALSILAQHGFEQYEISNFALPGYTCRHNLGYWRQEPYIGLGAAAAGCLPGHGHTAYVRTSNPSDLSAYLRMVEENAWTNRTAEAVSKPDAQYETLMLGLRTTQGISEEAYLCMHGEELDKRFGKTLLRLEKQQLLAHHQGWWYLTRRGMDVQNAILVELMDN